MPNFCQSSMITHDLDLDSYRSSPLLSRPQASAPQRCNPGEPYIYIYRAHEKGHFAFRSSRTFKITVQTEPNYPIASTRTTTRKIIDYGEWGKYVKVNQENHLRPLASKTTGQSKILGLAAGRFVSDTRQSMNLFNNVHRNTYKDIHNEHRNDEDKRRKTYV